MHCPNCATPVSSNTGFCPNCGTKLGDAPADAAANYPSTYPASSPTGDGSVIVLGQPEEKLKRVVAYLIDVVPMLILAFLHLLPVFGWMLYGLLHACYWLFRDINGASLGKMLMGSVVGSVDGSPSTTNQRIMRNVPLAIPGILGMIPVLGVFFEFGLALFIFGGEAIILLATGRRFGDSLAGTQVFRKLR